jgi:hypothetical protein
MSKDNGGPAFPESDTAYGGMSLRDYFAAAALTGYRTAVFQWYISANGKFTHPTQIAEWAYADADAMLAERNKNDTL